MPAMPWRTKTPVRPDQEYLAMATSLPLRSHRSIPRFMGLTLAITRQLEHTSGLVGYSLLAQPARKRFWTLSAWTDRDSLDAFVREVPHLNVMEKLRPYMGPTRFRAWTVLGSALPIPWDEAIERLLGSDAPSGGGKT